MGALNTMSYVEKITLFEPHCDSGTVSLRVKNNPIKKPGLLAAQWLEHPTGNGGHGFDSYLTVL